VSVFRTKKIIQEEGKKITEGAITRNHTTPHLVPNMILVEVKGQKKIENRDGSKATKGVHPLRREKESGRNRYGRFMRIGKGKGKEAGGTRGGDNQKSRGALFRNHS